MYSNQPSPAQDNNFIIKQHLRKPVVLFLGIISVLFAIMQVLTTFSTFEIFSYLEYLTDEMQWIIILLIVALIAAALSPIFLAVAFFSMYSASCDNNPYRTPVSGASALRGAGIASLISTLTVLFTILVIIIQLVTLQNNLPAYSRRSSLYYLSNIGAPAYADAADTTFGIIIVLILVIVPVIMYACGLMSMGSSIKNSVITGQLHTGGTVALGVSSILLGLLMLFVWILGTSSGDSTPAITHLIFILYILNYTLMAVFALGYKSHVMQSCNPYSNQANYYYTNNYASTEHNNGYTNPYSTPDAPAAPYQQSANAYNSVSSNAQSTPAQNTAPDISSVGTTTAVADSTVLICPECQSPVTQNQLFCGKCGTKLN